MIKQDHHIVNQCCCQKPRNEHKTNTPSTNFPERSVTEDEYPRCGCSRPDSFQPDYQQDKSPCLDRQTLNALNSFRQRACRFLNSETEVTSSNSDVHYMTQTCRNGNCRNEGNALQKAQEQINYAPESAFLKKIKEQCQYFQNNQETQNVSTCGQESDYVPYVCDKCVAKSKQILKLSEQLNSGRTKYSPNDSKNNNKSCRSICTDHQSKTSGLDFIEKTCRSALNEYQRSLANVGMLRDDDDFCQTQSNLTQSSNLNKSKEKEKNDKKSQHVSRSKRPKKRFHRRKRKSNDSGNNEPQENFEPTLKRPYDNSCERCWRYASPARSPVNKPGQRYDPNFRRAHSATNVPVTDEYEKGDSDIQENVPQRPSTGKKQSRRETIYPRTPPAREQYYANTQVKDLMHEPLQSYNEPLQPVSDRSHQRAQDVCDGRTSKSPEHCISINCEQQPRPNTTIPGSRTRDRRLSFDFDDLDVTQYKDIAIGSNRQNQSTGDYGKKSVKNTFAPDRSFREHQCNKRGACERSQSSPKYSAHSRTSRSNGGANQGTMENAFVQVDPNCTAHSSYREVLQPQNSRSPHMPASGYSRTDKGNQFSLKKGHGSYSTGQEYSGMESSSPVQHFQALPAAKTQSSVVIQDQSRRFEKQKPQSAGVGMTRCDCSNYENLSSAFGLEINEGKLRLHPFRPCNCRTQQTQTEGIDYRAVGCAENNMCCHCRWIGNLNNNSNRPGCFNARRESQDGCSHFGPSTNPDYRSCDKYFPNNPDPSICNQRNVSSFRNGNIDSDSPQDQSGVPHSRIDRIIPCPYRLSISNRGCLRDHNHTGSFETREDGNYSPVDRRNFRNGFTNDSNYSPKKYCVFYMTKNREDTGNDVEVLIEELTESCSRGTKGSKAKSLKEKMKRLMECQSDSMALRFQKGVSDTGKNSQNSRVLYF